MKNTPNPIDSNILKGDAALKRGSSGDFNLALDCYLEAAFHIVETNWHLPVRQKICSILAFDIDCDGEDEILFGTEEKLLFVYKPQSDNTIKNPLWSFKTKAWVTGIEVADINGDGELEIIVASDKIYILNIKGEKTDEYPSEHSISSMCIYADSKDGGLIVVGDEKGSIKCYDYNFSDKWTLSYQANSTIIDIAIGDFDGDGKIEVVAASEDKFVYILNDVGEEKEKIDTKHWIINMADCKMKNSKLRLFIGKFTGDTLVYKHKQTSQAVSLKQSGILDLKVEYIFDESINPQFIVGSSDRCLSIFDFNGEPIWIFETGLGQRAISVKRIGDGQLNLFVGTESGEVFSYSVNLRKDLVSKIKNAYEQVKTSDLLDLKLESNKLKILRNYVEYNPINENASIEKAEDFFSKNDFQNAVIASMEVWFNNCSYLWQYETKGRVYDLAPYILDGERGLLIGSDDGFLYCLNQEGKLNWRFSSLNDLRGTKQGIRGVFFDNKTKNIYTASADKSVYMLNYSGKPLWNFHHNDWLLFTCAGRFCEDKNENIFAGTEDGYVLSFDSSGLLLWKTKLGKRVRALTFCTITSSESYVIAGCDDNKVYIINSSGEIRKCFSTPHYVLVVQAADIDNDGQIEILTGNEDGHLHIYNFSGELLWRFETESWVAALDVFTNVENGDIEIVIGSQDNHVYVLNKYGALLWQYEANARVRTISADGLLSRISFGSYDKKAYILKQVDRDITFLFLNKLYEKFIKDTIDKQESKKLFDDESRHKRAFAYLFTADENVIKKGITDKSDIVKAAIGINLIENFLPKGLKEETLTKLIIESSRRVKAIIFCKLIQLMSSKNVSKRIVSKIVSDAIRGSRLTTSKIDIFRYWLVITNDCDDILRIAEDLLPENDEKIDDFLIDELNRACILALSKSSNDSGDFRIIETVKNISDKIGAKYPNTVIKLKEAFM